MAEERQWFIDLIDKTERGRDGLFGLRKSGAPIPYGLFPEVLSAARAQHKAFAIDPPPQDS